MDSTTFPEREDMTCEEVMAGLFIDDSAEFCEKAYTVLTETVSTIVNINNIKSLFIIELL
jgi:hypothetical protein